MQNGKWNHFELAVHEYGFNFLRRNNQLQLKTKNKLLKYL